MRVRRATLSDMGSIVDYIEEYQRKSIMSDIPFERKDFVKVAEYYLLSNDCIALIAEDNEVRGVLLGGLEPYFFNSKRNYATDLLFVATGGGPQLWKKFRDWAFEVGATRIIMGISSGDPRAGQLLESLGMESTGGMYVLCKESS